MAPKLRPAGVRIPAVLVFCFLALAAVAQTLPARLATPNEIRGMLVERVDVQHKTDGIVVGVITKHGREIIAYGKFDASDPRVPDGETVYEIGSITKVFTSLLLCDMALHGEVKLSDPVAKYLPQDVHVPTRNGKQITLLDLATHHSGLPRMPTNYNGAYTPQQMYDFLSHYTLPRDPGAKYEYSNLGGGLLAQALCLRAGTDYETLLRTRITGPLHMDHTALHMTMEMQTNSIPGRNNGNQAPNIAIDALEGAGAIRSTADDMLIFLAANMGIVKSPLLPAMKKMLSVRRDAGAVGEVALGWHVASGIVWHNGGTNGYHSYAGFDPHRKVGVVVLSNSTDFIDDIGRRVLNYPTTGPVEQHVGPQAAR